MDRSLTSSLLVKLFLGFALRQELKAILYQKEEMGPFVILPHEGEQYIGLFLESEKETLDQIKLRAMALLQSFHEQFPESKRLELPLHIFPRTFVR